MKYRFYYLISVLLVMASCTGYDKLLKSTDYDKKYEVAMQFYEEGEFVKAYTLFEQCASVYSLTEKADTINYFMAKSYFNTGDFYTAGFYFRSFPENFNRSPFVEECEYMGAYCHYMLSPRPSLDQTQTFLALSSFTMFLANYPESERVSKVKEIVTELQDKLVEKSFMSARLYYDLEEYKAAIIALQNSLADYPNTKHREQIMFLILKSKFLLAENSIISKKRERLQATLDEYYSFTGEFPESEYKKEASRMYDETNRLLN